MKFLVRVVGIDPGTDSWGIVGLEDEAIILDTSIPTKRVIEKPLIIVEILQSLQEIDLIVAPSGHGLPFTPIQALTERDLFYLTVKKHISTKITGLGEIARLLKDKGFTGYFIPSVKIAYSEASSPHARLRLRQKKGDRRIICSYFSQSQAMISRFWFDITQKNMDNRKEP